VLSEAPDKVMPRRPWPKYATCCLFEGQQVFINAPVGRVIYAPTCVLGRTLNENAHNYLRRLESFQSLPIFFMST